MLKVYHKYIKSKVEVRILKDLLFVAEYFLFVAEYFINCFFGVKAAKFEMWRDSLLY
jgi:hypothetical protein